MDEPRNYATRDEVDKALAGLSDGQLLKLEEFAKWRIRAIGAAALGRDHDDLLQEAFTTTMAGADGRQGRPWKKDIDIIRHLTQAMRSISSNWKEEAAARHEVPDTQARVDEEGKPVKLTDTLASKDPDPFRTAAARIEVASVIKQFDDDDNAILVLEGLTDGFKREEFAELGVSATVYDATLKRIRYKLRHRNK